MRPPFPLLLLNKLDHACHCSRMCIFNIISWTPYVRLSSLKSSVIIPYAWFENALELYNKIKILVLSIIGPIRPLVYHQQRDGFLVLNKYLLVNEDLSVRHFFAVLTRHWPLVHEDRFVSRTISYGSYHIDFLCILL